MKPEVEDRGLIASDASARRARAPRRPTRRRSQTAQRQRLGSESGTLAWILRNRRRVAGCSESSFCRRLLSSLLGTGGVGKSALRTLQALALASGRNLTGEHVFQRTRVLIISLEDDAHELHRRVLAARLHHGVAADELDSWLFLAAPGGAAGKLMTLGGRIGQMIEGDLAKHIRGSGRGKPNRLGDHRSLHQGTRHPGE